MGIFSGLFRSRDKPQNRTAGSAYSFFFGGSTAGKRVNERSAMQMTAVYSCVRILAEAVAGLPLHLYHYKEDGGKEKAIDHPLYLLLHDEPNPEMSSFVFRETLMTHLLLWGNAWSDSKSQKGAYKILSNAKKCADANPGYSVFDNNGVNIYTPNTSTQTAPDVPFTVKVSISDLNIRKGPGTDYAKTGKFTGKGVFTIVEVQSGQGSSAGWGRLKSGAGWISLDYAVKTE